MADIISPTDYEVAAQFAHFFTAAFLVSQLGRFGLKGLLVGSIGMLVFAAIKEFWYDVKHENPLVRGSSPLDFGMYTAGNALAVVLHFIK
jgi:hypothetical protein